MANRPVKIILMCWTYYKLIQLIDWTFSNGSEAIKRTPNGVTLLGYRKTFMKILKDNGYEIF